LNNIVVKGYFAVHIADTLSLQEAAPLRCASITANSPLMQFDLKQADRVGVAGIGGLALVLHCA
jgi:alcohol dehydrogenase (NADP+)